MNDYLVRIMSNDGHLLGLAAVTTKLVNEIAHIHHTSPTATAALGRALTGAALLAALLKRGQSLALTIAGDGPLGKIVVEAERNGTLRGMVSHPEVDLPPHNGKLRVGDLVGKSGVITVIKDLGRKENYTGIVPLVTGEIAEDLTYYLAKSEQIPSAMGLGVYVSPPGEVTLAGGFLVQSFPPADEHVIEELEERIRSLKAVTTLLREGEMPETILEKIFSPIAYHVLEKMDLRFTCSCNRERLERVIISLGREEIKRHLTFHGDMEITCHYCLRKYTFSRQELEEIMKKF
ncbi:MAG TPA: Hsp33 family molecular chaperone HslO [Syntrophales bacterium]|nr:Hsp33 family molecular chaperone HslO [Syntrophales bacterium]HOL58266.1 Hsp33 family molecular chaperone HslO [Syntrophales bacterium]HPO34435.1 Hsp33 family molecular chaperone HslO [Syntrophales bacterium]